jgi:hypothetical protein
MLSDLSDIPTIKNALRKRVDALDPDRRIRLADVFVKFTPDAVKILMVVDIDFVPHFVPPPGQSEPLRRDLTHDDLMNWLDRVVERYVKPLRTVQRIDQALTGEVNLSQAELDGRLMTAARGPAANIISE